MELNWSLLSLGRISLMIYYVKRCTDAGFPFGIIDIELCLPLVTSQGTFLWWVVSVLLSHSLEYWSGDEL